MAIIMIVIVVIVIIVVFISLYLCGFHLDIVVWVIVCYCHSPNDLSTDSRDVAGEHKSSMSASERVGDDHAETIDLDSILYTYNSGDTITVNRT